MSPALVFALALGSLGAPDGGAVESAPAAEIAVPPSPILVVDLPDAGSSDDRMMVLGAPQADAGAEEQIIILIPKRPPPPPPAPPEPPKPMVVVFQHDPRPRVEWGQAGLELAVTSGVNVVGSAALFALQLIPVTIAWTFFNSPGVANGIIDGFALVDAFALPLVTTIAIERLKAGSRHYQLEGLGWWITYGSGVGLQLISTLITLAVVNVNNLLTSGHLLVFALLTPITQTVVANYLATPRDPLAPLEASYRRPVIDVAGRPVPTLTLLSGSF